MNLYLLLNTCGDQAVVALGGADGGVLAEERMPGRLASEQMLGAVRRVVGGRSVRELAGIGVVAGPGSFTGVRVGLAAAKGLCDAGSLRMVAMSRLELVQRGGATAVLDAGRGEYFVSGDRMVRELPMGELVTCEARVAERTGASLVPEPGGVEMLEMLLSRLAEGRWDDAASVDATYLRRTDAELAVERAGVC